MRPPAERPPSQAAVSGQDRSQAPETDSCQPERPLLGQHGNGAKHQPKFQAKMAEVDPGSQAVQFVAAVFGLLSLFSQLVGLFLQGRQFAIAFLVAGALPLADRDTELLPVAR